MDIIWALAFSSHLGMKGGFNEVHPHVRVVNDDKIAGAYYNSESRLSLYAGYRYELNNVGAELALVTGYNDKVVPYIRVTYDFNDNIRAYAAPAKYSSEVGDDIGIVIGFEMMIK
tara:strand:+ start:8920 stop:9264 length:345 start_codon:yes stop_codon:yes gene_type:complete